MVHSRIMLHTYWTPINSSCSDVAPRSRTVGEKTTRGKGSASRKRPTPASCLRAPTKWTWVHKYSSRGHPCRKGSIGIPHKPNWSYRIRCTTLVISLQQVQEATWLQQGANAQILMLLLSEWSNNCLHVSVILYMRFIPLLYLYQPVQRTTSH